MRFCKALVALAIFSLFAAPFAAHAAPTVSFKAPADSQALRQSRACEVAGSSINTSASVGSKTAAPYQCDIDTANFADGSCTLMAVATDKVGATSSTLTIANVTGGDEAFGGAGGKAACDRREGVSGISHRECRVTYS